MSLIHYYNNCYAEITATTTNKMNNILPRFLTKSSTLTFITVPLKSKLHYTALWSCLVSDKHFLIRIYFTHRAQADQSQIQLIPASKPHTGCWGTVSLLQIYISRTKPPITVVTVVWQVAQIHSQTPSFWAFNKFNQHKFRSILKLN